MQTVLSKGEKSRHLTNPVFSRPLARCGLSFDSHGTQRDATVNLCDLLRSSFTRRCRSSAETSLLLGEKSPKFHQNKSTKDQQLRDQHRSIKVSTPARRDLSRHKKGEQMTSHPFKCSGQRPRVTTSVRKQKHMWPHITMPDGTEIRVQRPFTTHCLEIAGHSLSALPHSQSLLIDRSRKSACPSCCPTCQRRHDNARQVELKTHLFLQCCQCGTTTLHLAILRFQSILDLQHLPIILQKRLPPLLVNATHTV